MGRCYLSAPSDPPETLYDPTASYFFWRPTFGRGTLWGHYDIVGGIAGTAFAIFRGKEIDRVFMPEPQGSWLAVTALTSLSGIALLRTRRRREIEAS